MERNISYIAKRGSGKAAVREVTSTGSTPQALQCLPLIKSSKISYEKPYEDNYDEGGNNYPILGNIKTESTLTFMQTDKSTLMMPIDLEGKYYHMVKQINDTAINSKYYFLCVPIMKFGIKVDLSSPGQEQEVPFSMYPTTALLCMDLTGFASTNHGFSVALTCTTFPIPAGQVFGIYEQASS